MTDLDVRERVINAAVAAGESLGDVAVERNREEAVSRFPSLIFRDPPETDDYGTHGVEMHSMQLDVEGYVTALPDENIGAVLNALYARLKKALTEDPTLGGVTIDVRGRGMTPTFNREEGATTPTASFAAAFEIDYWTVPGNPYQLGAG